MIVACASIVYCGAHPAADALSQGFGLEDVKNLLGHSTIVLMARGMDAVLGG